MSSIDVCSTYVVNFFIKKYDSRMMRFNLIFLA